MAVRLSALRDGRPLSHRKIPGTHFCWELSQPREMARRIRSIENSNNIGNRTRDLPACKTLPQQNTLPHIIQYTERINLYFSCILYLKHFQCCVALFITICKESNLFLKQHSNFTTDMLVQIYFNSKFARNKTVICININLYVFYSNPYKVRSVQRIVSSKLFKFFIRL
jgi:hypothetical protein